MVQGPPASVRRSPPPHDSRARPNAWARRLLLAGAFSALLSCTAPPELRPGRLARIETVPAGARLITLTGEVFRTPVEVPLEGGETQYYELRLRGYGRRRIALDRAQGPTPLQALSICTLLPLLAEGEWERIHVVDGLARIDLVPTPGD